MCCWYVTYGALMLPGVLLLLLLFLHHQNVGRVISTHEQGSPFFLPIKFNTKNVVKLRALSTTITNRDDDMLMMFSQFLGQLAIVLSFLLFRDPCLLFQEKIWLRDLRAVFCIEEFSCLYFIFLFLFLWGVTSLLIYNYKNLKNYKSVTVLVTYRGVNL